MTNLLNSSSLVHRPSVAVETENSVQVVMPYDENLLDRTRTQWQFGDWESLTKLKRDTLQHHPDRAKLALLAAAGRLQTGESNEAKAYIRLAQDWGVSNKLISQILIAGVYNSMGRAAAIGKQQHRSLQHFKSAITIGTPGSDTKLLAQARAFEQLVQLGISSQPVFDRTSTSKADNSTNGQSSSPESMGKQSNDNFHSFTSEKYWENRYKEGGTSGYGSYGRLAEFKANVVNQFIKDKGIERVIEFGCGDGNQLSLLQVKNYVGIDISPTVIDKCKDRFNHDASKLFLTNENYLEGPLKGALTLSLDVIFHLVEDDVFENYMSMLFGAAERYCIIYACDEDRLKSDPIHVRRRKFTEWVSINLKEWRLMQIRCNDYPHDGSRNPKDLSFSNFYFYERVNKLSHSLAK